MKSDTVKALIYLVIAIFVIFVIYKVWTALKDGLQWWEGLLGLLPPGTQIKDLTGDTGQAISDSAELSASQSGLTAYSKTLLSSPGFTPGVNGTLGSNSLYDSLR